MAFHQVFRRFQKSMNFIKEAIGESHRSDIDGLRGIAVLAVVFFHAFPSVLKGGYVGVDIFFILSGYLITSIILRGLEKGTFSFKTFYIRRIRRIFPALALVLISCLIFGWFSLLPDEFNQLGSHATAGAMMISNFILSSEAGYFDNISETKPLLHLWSLGIEEQFYLIWPFVIYFSWKKRWNGFLVGLVLAVLSFGLNLSWIETKSVQTFYNPLTRFWELLLGGLLAYTHVQQIPVVSSFSKKLLPYANLKSWLGVLLILCGVFLLKHGIQFPGYAALVPTIGTMLIISAGPSSWINRKIMSNGFLVWVGAISYPLYLWHWPFLSFATIMESKMPNLVIRVIAVVLSILLAFITTVFVERWFRFGQNLSRKFIGPAFAVISIGLVGFYIQKNEGFQNRFQEILEMNKQLKRTSLQDQECLNLFAKGSVKFNFCRFNGDLNSDNEVVALIGDSHAHALYPGFAEILKQQGKDTILLANSGCPPFKGLVQAKTTSELPACEQRIDQILETVTNHPFLSKKITKVFITSRGAGYIHKSGFKENEKPWVVEYTIPALKNLIPEKAFAESLLNTTRFLINSGKSVFYIMENPELGFDVRACIDRPIALTKKTNECSITFSDVLKRQNKYRQALTGIQLTGFEIIDPTSLFCTKEICSPLIETKLMYSDDDHLSVAGSFYMTEKLLAQYFNEERLGKK